MGETKTIMAAIGQKFLGRKYYFVQQAKRCALFSPSSKVLCNQRSIHTSAKLGEKWDLVSSVCLERFPVLAQIPSEMEVKFGNMLSELELEQSVMSDHELRHKQDLVTAERRKQDDYDESEAESVLQTAMEAEDEWEAERNKFTPASRMTEADNTNVLTSTDRKLDQKLLLLIKQKLGDSSHWVTPQGVRKEGESMRQAAERVLSSTCGGGVQAKFIGNAPCGFIKYKYNTKNPSPEQAVGAKVFYFKAQLKSGDVIKSSPDVENFVWITKDQLSEYVPSSYEQSLNKFILDL